MPKLSSSRISRDFVNEACAKAVPVGSHYLGHYHTITEDAKIVVMGYYVDPAFPSAPKCVPVTDRAVLRAVLDPASVPAPPSRPVKDAPAAAPAPAGKPAGKK